MGGIKSFIKNVMSGGGADSVWNASNSASQAVAAPDPLASTSITTLFEQKAGQVTQVDAWSSPHLMAFTSLYGRAADLNKAEDFNAVRQLEEAGTTVGIVEPLTAFFSTYGRDPVWNEVADMAAIQALIQTPAGQPSDANAAAVNVPLQALVAPPAAGGGGGSSSGGSLSGINPLWLAAGGLLAFFLFKKMKKGKK